MIPKFRAWDKVLKEMVQVNALVLDEQVVKVTYKNGNVAKDDMKEYELMQSTGLKDKNGKEIFEGDIVSIDTDEFDLLFVKYESGIYWLMDDEECVEHLSDYYKYVSIVGNIYENPELLEVE